MTNETDYSKQLLLDFHNQFSELYNQRQRVFTKILTAVIIIFSAYGIVLEKTLNATVSSPCNPQLLPIASIFVCLISTYLICILIHQGWNIRKTQWVINRIRNNIVPKEKKDIIFENYGEKKSSLPDFYMINIFSFEVLKITITLITIFVCNKSVHCWLIASSVITLISVTVDTFFFQLLTSKK